MGKILVHTFSTLDGVMDPSMEEAFHPVMDEDVMQQTVTLLDGLDGVLLGRHTFQGLAKSWGGQTGAIADHINALPKYVLSRTLQSADEWNNSTVVSWDDVPGLRERADLVTYGCGRLARDLAAAGLLDTLQIYVAPVVGGGSTRLFDAPEELITGLRLEEAKAFATGVVRLTYAVSPPA
jgi:dihydrofolate reductase